MAANEPVPSISSKYKVLRLLGTGGMGSVYLARDLILNRDVAIKLIAWDKVGDTAARRRLLREAQAAAALDHPFICTVHEVVVDPDGRACIVMQYAEGETLAARLRSGPLEPAAAFALAADIADALRAAHARGIIHRDLKPQNIVISPSGRPKLLDFGIARMLGSVAAPHGSEEETQTTLTGSGQVVGTPKYMSPEQLQQRPVDARSDLFSLGAVLFECLTGHAAFEGRNAIEIGGHVLHAEPPAISSLRPELTERHDEIVSRLLAKDPGSRFQSAEELLGALRVLGPAGVQSASVDVAAPREALGWKHAVAMALLIVVALAVGLWRWQHAERFPAPTAEAQQWYARGTESIRNGAYYSGRLALAEAVRLFPNYPQAYARLAEAHSELDESREAQNALLKVTQLVPDRSRLDAADSLTIDAITAVVLRNLDRGVNAYRQLAERRSSEAGAWLDLGRAQEAMAARAEARKSYERATQIDSQYAAAYLRLGALDGQEGRRAQALGAFENAERLYKTASNTEGQTETLLQRGFLAIGLGDAAAARAALERAHVLAVSMGSRYHEIRAQLQLSAATAAEGRLRDAELLAAKTVEDARDAGLDTVAAEGLVELGTALQLRRELDAAQTQLSRALKLAEERGASRIATRARLQSASLLLIQGKPAEALTLADGELEFLRTQRYPRLELTALAIMSRAREDLSQFPEARLTAQRALERAEQIQDDRQIASALESLAGQSATMGLLPEALHSRERTEDIHRRLGNAFALPFDLTNRAELLIRLGRGEEAEHLLNEVEAGIAKGIDAYVGRARRVKVLRTLRAAVETRYADVIRLGSDVGPGSGTTPDATSLLASALVDHARARMGHALRGEPIAVPSSVALSTAREIRYWRVAARLVSGDGARALDEASELLQDLPRAPTDELEWRLAALGGVAARRSARPDNARDLAERARQAWQRLETAWKTEISIYGARPDIVQLRRESNLQSAHP
jgi:hypothetical protein